MSGLPVLALLAAEETVDVDLESPRAILAVAAVLLLFGATVQPLHRLLARTTWPLPDPQRPAFSLVDVALVTFVFLWLQIVVALGVSMVLPEDGAEPGLGLVLSATVALQGGVAASILWIAWRRPDGRPSLGLRRGANLRAAAFGVVRYGGMLPFLLASMALSPLLLEYVLGLEHEVQDVAKMLAAAAGGERVLAAVCAVLVIPLLEEVLFRGFLQNALEARLGAVRAVGLTSLAFAALHGTSALLPIFVLSVTLGTIMLRTRRLAACWFVHGLHNGLTTSLLYLMPEQLLQQPH